MTDQIHTDPKLSAAGHEAAVAALDIIDAFNSGDAQTVLAAHIPGAVIVDEFPPYRWGSEDSAAKWLQALVAHQAEEGITEGSVVYAAPTRVASDGESAYVLVPTIFRATQGGKRTSVVGTNTFIMTCVDGAWKIAGSAYAAALANHER